MTSFGGFDIEAKYVNPDKNTEIKTENFDDIDFQKFIADHVLISQYTLQIVACENDGCHFCEGRNIQRWKRALNGRRYIPGKKFLKVLEHETDILNEQVPMKS